MLREWNESGVLIHWKLLKPVFINITLSVGSELCETSVFVQAITGHKIVTISTAKFSLNKSITKFPSILNCELTHRCPVTLYYAIRLGQNWLR